MTKRILAGLLAGVSTFATATLADDFTIDPAISKVVVYRGGGATVTRTGTITLPAGRHTITAQKLTESLDESQLSIGFNASGVRLYSMDVDTAYSVTPASDRQAALKAELEAIDAKVASLAAAEQAKNMQLAFLRTLNQDGGKADQSLPFADWQNALTFIGDKGVKVLGEIEAIKNDRKGLEEKRKALLRELENTGPKRTDYKEATFEVMVPTAQEVAYEVSYFVRDARWNMGLEGALDTSTKSLTLLSKAAISQNSGEDWTGVQMSLSNNAPSRDLGAINQYPRILSLVDPRAELDAMLDKARSGRMQSGYVSQAPEPVMEEMVVTGNRRVRSSSTSFDRMYEVSGTVTIPSSGEAEFIDLMDHQSSATLTVRANPSANRTAYLFVDTELKDFESLRNVAPKLRRDGHYVGEGRWPNLEANTKLNLPYGEDRAISIDYTEQAPEDGDAGLFGSKKVEEKRYIITVTNNHPEPMTVEIFDQIPVSGHEDIKVKTLSGATKPTETDMDDKQGLMMWRKTMAPGEIWKINHSYQVTYPSNMELVEQ